MLSSKLVLVTGAGSGIGEALCRVLLREGSKVAAVDINPISPEKYSKSEGRFKEFQADVSSQKEVLQLFKNIQNKFGYSPDCAVNCAGIFNKPYSLDANEEQFDETIRINLKGSYLVCQAVSKSLLERMKKDSTIVGGSIVNVASISATAGFSEHVDYAASKSGLLGLTKTLAKELGPHNIRCNVVLPGFTTTPLLKDMPKSLMKYYIDKTPLGRFGKPEETAEVCAFLLSDRSSFMTGSIVEVTGGIAM